MLRKALACFAFAALVCLLSLPAFSTSQVRIVRLSYIAGGVQIDRGTGHYDNAILNLPIVQGTQIKTASDGRAEIEFEDGSTLRLAANTEVQFSRLSLGDSGGKLSTVQLNQGTAYVNFAGQKNDELTIAFGHEKLPLTRSAHVRVDASAAGEEVAVFKGDVQVEDPSSTTTVKKKQTAKFDNNGNLTTVAKDIAPEPLDSWDKQQSQYLAFYRDAAYRSYSPYAYGSSDLAYYGAFYDVGPYGMVWRPYFVDASWDPFMNGAWAFSPGFGFGWVSAYPWGWVPYHYGNWVYMPGVGWGWQPGGTWMPVYSQPVVVNAPSGFAPPRPPVSGPTRGIGIVTVNRGPASAFSAGSGSKIMIRNNSAGLGIPRGQVRDLPSISSRIQRSGFAMQRVERTTVAPRPSYQPAIGRDESMRGMPGYSAAESRIGGSGRPAPSGPGPSAPSTPAASSSRPAPSSGSTAGRPQR